MNWNTMTESERLQFCDEWCSELRTKLPWEELSPTSQLILQHSGITNKGYYD